MDVTWFDFNLLLIEIEEHLKKLTPKFYQAFNSREAP